MKKYFITFLALILAVSAIYGGAFYWGFYFPGGGQPQAVYRAEGTRLQQCTDSGFRDVQLRGVEISSSVPGAYATAYEPTEKDYLRWLTAIGEMGANAVRAANILDDDFYNALYAYNQSADRPLYLLQGITVPDDGAPGEEDAYADSFLGHMLARGREAVDVIHGRKVMPGTNLRGGGTFHRDVSPWTVGILVGTEWSADVIAYTDHSALRTGDYTGAYFGTTADATPFEAVMARVMDSIASYEAGKYSALRPVAFMCTPECDFLEYEEVYARQLNKYAKVNPEHVRPTDAMEAGTFACYRLVDFCDDFSACLSQGQKEQLGSALNGLDTAQPYGGYLQLLARVHTMPVVAAGYGASSARGAVKLGEKPSTEEAQGAFLMKVSSALEEGGWSGGFLSTWQDEWERRSWNTAYATAPSMNYRWHDLQSEAQNFGLMAFDPGREAACVLDGRADEWSDRDIAVTADGLSLSVRYDAEGIYLLIRGASEGELLYIPMDILPELGADHTDNPRLSLSRNADFLLCLNGTENSRLLVQERCDSLRERFEQETAGIDPFVSYPSIFSGRFVPVRMALRNSRLADDLGPETAAQRRLGTWETGVLTAGCGDPASEEYNSLADLCFGPDGAEVRLPWLLLNVGDPSSMAVHRDYYTHYGVELRSVRQMGIGLARQGQTEEVAMQSVRLSGWMNRVTYRERLKQSYWMMKELWGGAHNA